MVRRISVRWITTAEAGKRLGVTAGQVARLCRSGNVDAVFNSELKRWFISPVSVERMISDRSVGGSSNR